MLEATAGLRDHIEKQIPVVRHHTPHAVDLPRDRFDVLGRLRTVPHTRLTEVHQQVRRAVDHELIDGRRAGDDRRVDQGVEVGCAIRVRPAVGLWSEAGQAPTPAGRQLQRDVVRAAGVVIREREERRRAVEHGKVLLDPVRADRHLPPIHQVGHHDAVAAAGQHSPAILARFLHRQRRTTDGPGRDRLDVASKLPHQIGARGPHGHHQLDLGSAAGRHARLYADVVGMRRREPQRVGDRLRRLRQG